MNERLPTEPIRQFLHNVEAVEIGTLIGSGAIAYYNGELVPTVMAIGTIVGLAAWHGYHWVKDRFNRDDSQSPPSSDSPGSDGNSPLDIATSDGPMEFAPLPPDPALKETLGALENIRPVKVRRSGHHGGPKSVRKRNDRGLKKLMGK